MKSSLNIILFTIISAAFLNSCKKESKCIAGTGGDITLVVYPKHHGKSVWSLANYRDTVYLKFNTQEFPGASPSNYDLAVVGDSGEDHVSVDSLKCGDYFIYTVCFDTSALFNERVFGGTPFSTEATSGQIDVTVNVDE